MKGSKLLKEIMNKLYMSVDELSSKSGVSLENLNDFLNEDKELNTKDFLSLSKLFNISMEALVTGELLDDGDKISYHHLTPSEDKHIELFINKCRKVVEQSNLIKYSELLMPKPSFNSKRRFLSFEGGVFSSTGWRECYIPYVDIEKVISLDIYDIFDKFKNHPRTYGQMIHYLKEKGDVAGLKHLEKRNLGSSDWTTVQPIPPILFNDIVKCTDIRFFESIEYSVRDLTHVLYRIDSTKPSYWQICKFLLDKGATLQRYTEFGENGSYREAKDTPATMMFEYIVNLNLKQK